MSGYLAVKQAVASCGWRLSATLRRPGCIVLMYHRVGRATDPFPHTDLEHFRSQIRWLAANCDIIRPEALRERAQQPPHAKPPVLLTFDDGTRDYYEVVYPVLEEFQVPAVVFPITDYVDRPRLTWWDRLHLAVHHARVDTVSPPWQPRRTLRLGGPRNDHVVRTCKDHLKSVADAEKERLLDELVLALGDPMLPDVGRPMMNWDEIRATMDLTTYGGHTHTHPLLPNLDSRRLEQEICACRDRIAAETGVRPTLFAYPNGDATPEVKAFLPEYGFDVAFTTAAGLFDCTTDRLEVPRVGVGKIVPTVWMLTEAWTLARPAALEGMA